MIMQSSSKNSISTQAGKGPALQRSRLSMAIGIAGVVMVAAMSGSALAAKGAPGVPGGGSGGKPGGETAAQNLSVPTIMVGGSAGGLICGASVDLPSALKPPTGDPVTGYELPGYFYVQKVHTWQAQCVNAAANTISAYAAWGDNLGGDAKLRAGSPIRVELLLWDAASTEQFQGYEVVKLDPSALDREAPYGVLAASDGAGGYSATPMLFTPVVHDSQASLTITGTDFSVSENPITPEINATGKVVYGYNLRVPAAGDYVITFKMPNVDFQGCDALLALAYAFLNCFLNVTKVRIQALLRPVVSVLVDPM